jgi:hypothetical protein
MGLYANLRNGNDRVTVFSFQMSSSEVLTVHLRPQAMIVALLLLPLSGCMVSSKTGEKGDKDVAISTPLGGMSVKTDQAAVQSKLGLPLYPGAVMEKKKADDSGSADVDMSFGPFHLRVLAMSFTSPDSPDKISAYYRKALSQYSDVIECRDKQPVGKPERTGLGLTCQDNDDAHTHRKVIDDDDKHETELKAGSASRQHLVSLKPKDGGTEFGLVFLELPRDDSKAN